jgi:hypothetical protein
MTTWKDIPGFEGAYAVGWDGRRAWVASLPRTVVRRNGNPYRVRGRMMKIQAHNPGGEPVVYLATGRTGRYKRVFVERLIDDMFGTGR